MPTPSRFLIVSTLVVLSVLLRPNILWSAAEKEDIDLALFLPLISSPDVVVPPGPVGHLLAFDAMEGAEKDIYAIVSDGTGLSKLTRSPHYDFSPSWSPDNSKIVYVSELDAPESADVHVMTADGSGDINLTNAPGNYYGPTWSPDGSKIIFIKGVFTDVDVSDAILVMDSDGRNIVPLMTGLRGVYELSWSPDGNKISFSSNGDLYIMDANGDNLRNVSNHPSFESGGRWSPDSRALAFDSERDGNGEIYVVDSDGKNLRNLTQNPSNDFGPAWTPDGARIAFVTYRNEDWYLYIMSSDGSNQIQLSAAPGFYQHLYWSPDGTQLAFLKDWIDSAASDLAPSIVIPPTSRDIGVMDQDGRNERRLTMQMEPGPPVWQH